MSASEHLSDEQFDYRGSHQPSMDEETSAGMHEVDKMMPDYYEHPNYYHHLLGAKDPQHDRYHQETYRIINAVRGRPDQPVTAFRAVPKEAGDEINPGDWVTPSRTYAKEHGESYLGGRGKYKIIAKKVPAGHLRTSGDYAPEFGYTGGAK